MDNNPPESPRSLSYNSRVQENEGNEEDEWDFMKDELEAFEKAIQSFEEEKNKLLIIEEKLSPKIQKKKPPLMPKPVLIKNGVVPKPLVSRPSSSISNITCDKSTPKPYMETDI